MLYYKPEGRLIDTPQNRAMLRCTASLQEAYAAGRILEARAVVCDSDHNLIVDLGCCRGIIPRCECAVGIAEGSTRDIAIISRVNKPVCFKITDLRQQPDGSLIPLLSRRQVQEDCIRDYLSFLKPGDVIDCRVTHLEPFGCFVDIGCGIASLIPIDCISISRISHPSDRFRVGQDIRAAVKSIDPMGRISLTHKELLGTWEENASLFSCGQTVAGIVRSVEEYGVFVELTPNLAGLAEPRENVEPGQAASVYIKNLIPEKMKVKLIIVDSFDAHYPNSHSHYYIQDSHIHSWRYSPSSSTRLIETVFE
ncbi:MAG: S1 RNA-binding domain-containing protein [Provencibacterium sp.]|jgi:small subunit ribosomal protein S1|nr:S1 RNA-binding domain-containing protein [Provencibacterium sp.]